MTGQRIRCLTTRDRVHVAWAEAGRGRALVKPANWLTHLEYDLDSPVWRHWIAFLSGAFRFIRYDERGCGMTDHRAQDLSAGRWIDDLEAVVDAARIDAPFVLLGISQGAVAAIEYAVRHPERVSRLVLYGGYARGWARRGQPEVEAFNRALLEIVRAGWGSDNPAFRQVFTSRFMPGATDEQVRWFNDLCQRTTTGEVAARLLEARSVADVTALLPEVRVPTLVMHARDDGVVPLAEGRLLAAEIPDAAFVELDSRNHILLEHEPAWQAFKECLLDFVSDKRVSALRSLSTRERDVLKAVAAGLTNAQVADRLAISEHTVRNHLTNIFGKLGIHSRAQAIVVAHEHGLA